MGHGLCEERGLARQREGGECVRGREGDCVRGKETCAHATCAQGKQACAPKTGDERGWGRAERGRACPMCHIQPALAMPMASCWGRTGDRDEVSLAAAFHSCAAQGPMVRQ